MFNIEMFFVDFLHIKTKFDGLVLYLQKKVRKYFQL